VDRFNLSERICLTRNYSLNARDKLKNGNCRYVIIGAGAAGFAAAEVIRKYDASAEILPICEEPEGFYSRPALAFFLTGELNEAQLFPMKEQDYRRLNLKPLIAHASQILPNERLIELEDGSKVSYDRLLIATGATAAKSKAPGQELEGVIKLDNLGDARKILKLARRSRCAVVVGGGITALEIVEGLRARGVKVHYFLRKDRYWGNVLDETESKIVEHRLIEEGVRIHYHTDLAEILGRKGRVTGVRTQDGKIIECSLVAIAIGIIPRLELAKTAGLAIDRGILVNEHLQTSWPEIYAAGDVAQVFDPLTGKNVLDSLWGPARDQGRIAGLNMVGKSSVYLKPIAFNVTRLSGLTTTIIGAVGTGRDDDLVGIARGDSEIWRELPDAIAAQDNFNVNRLRILVGKNSIKGALVMGDQTLSRPLQQMILRQVDISSIRSKLLSSGPRLGEVIAGFWTELKLSHAA
jgi:NAD(P)H-nitrite reductase large subunit